jgi:gliding motility-associated-like protein
LALMCKPATAYICILLPMHRSPLAIHGRMAAPPLYIAGQPGTYAVTVTSNGCSVSDTITVTEGELPVSLPADTTLCDGEAMRLIAGDIPGASYLWQDGDTSSIYNATGQGLYTVTATKGICSTSDSIIIARFDCSACKVFIPAAFTPNGDGRNDGFSPLFSRFCSPDDYDFRVFNRYGQMIFRSFTPSAQWDGRFNNRPADLGTYMYHLSYRIAGKKYSDKGDVVLVR